MVEDSGPQLSWEEMTRRFVPAALKTLGDIEGDWAVRLTDSTETLARLGQDDATWREAFAVSVHVDLENFLHPALLDGTRDARIATLEKRMISVQDSATFMRADTDALRTYWYCARTLGVLLLGTPRHTEGVSILEWLIHFPGSENHDVGALDYVMDRVIGALATGSEVLTGFQLDSEQDEARRALMLDANRAKDHRRTLALMSFWLAREVDDPGGFMIEAEYRLMDDAIRSTANELGTRKPFTPDIGDDWWKLIECANRAWKACEAKPATESSADPAEFPRSSRPFWAFRFGDLLARIAGWSQLEDASAREKFLAAFQARGALGSLVADQIVALNRDALAADGPNYIEWFHQSSVPEELGDGVLDATPAHNEYVAMRYGILLGISPTPVQSEGSILASVIRESTEQVKYAVGTVELQQRHTLEVVEAKMEEMLQTLQRVEQKIPISMTASRKLVADRIPDLWPQLFGDIQHRLAGAEHQADQGEFEHAIVDFAKSVDAAVEGLIIEPWRASQMRQFGVGARPPELDLFIEGGNHERHLRDWTKSRRRLADIAWNLRHWAKPEPPYSQPAAFRAWLDRLRLDRMEMSVLAQRLEQVPDLRGPFAHTPDRYDTADPGRNLDQLRMLVVGDPQKPGVLHMMVKLFGTAAARP